VRAATSRRAAGDGSPFCHAARSRVGGPAKTAMGTAGSAGKRGGRRRLVEIGDQVADAETPERG
jgi:hypothetical protein